MTLSVAGLMALGSRVAPLRREWVTHKPHPKQAEFLALDCEDALFGGAAGGGKSDALLMAALQYAHVPGYAALILRRTYPDLTLPGAIMDRAKSWLPSEFWNEQKRRFRLPCPGGGYSTLTFGHLDREKDMYSYQGAELQFVGFDEMTQFPERWALYLFSRLRKPTSGKLAQVPLRFRGATNPGGLGHEWVKRRYVDPDTASGAFVPSMLLDNPSVDREGYLRMLAKLDATTQRQLRDGMWIRDLSTLVYAFDPSVHVARNVLPLKTWSYVVGIDYGFTDDVGIAVVGWATNSPISYIVHTERHEHQTPSDAAVNLKRVLDHYQPFRVVGDSGGLGKGYIEEARKRYTLPIVAAQKNDKRGYISLYNGALQNGTLQLLADTEELQAEYVELPWHDEKREREADGFANHVSDAALYAWREARSYSEPDAPGTLSVEEARERDEQAFIDEHVRRRKGRWDQKLANQAKR